MHSNNLATASSARSSSSTLNRKRDAPPDTDGDDSEELDMIKSEKPVARQPARPGQEDDTSTFMSAYKSEETIAAYLGFGNCIQLRRYLLSHYFLKYWLRLASHQWSRRFTTCTPVGTDSLALGMVKESFVDHHRLIWPKRSKFTTSFSDIDAHRPTGPEYPIIEHVSIYVAHILVIMVDESKSWSYGDKLEIDPEHQKVSNADLSHYRKQLSSLPLEGPGYGDIIAPAFDCGERFKESDLEKYNRAWQALRYFSFVANPSMIRKTNRVWAIPEESNIAVEHIPNWMREVKQNSVPSRMPLPTLSREKPASQIKSGETQTQISTATKNKDGNPKIQKVPNQHTSTANGHTQGRATPKASSVPTEAHLRPPPITERDKGADKEANSGPQQPVVQQSKVPPQTSSPTLSAEKHASQSKSGGTQTHIATTTPGGGSPKSQKMSTAKGHTQGRAPPRVSSVQTETHLPPLPITLAGKESSLGPQPPVVQQSKVPSQKSPDFSPEKPVSQNNSSEQEKQVPTATAGDGIPKTATALPPLSITLNYKRAKLWDRQALNAHVDEGYALPASTMQSSSGDPRLLSNSQFLDSIRSDYKCAKNQLQISDAVLFIDRGEVLEDPERYPLLDDDCDWDLVRRELGKPLQHVSVQVKLRVLGEDE